MISRSANSVAPPGIGTSRGTLRSFPDAPFDEKLNTNCSIRRGGVRETRPDPPAGLDDRETSLISMEQARFVN